MRKIILFLSAIGAATSVAVFLWQRPQPDAPKPPGGGAAAMQASKASPVAGSRSCRPCHEKFYQLWATSHHGLAMQPFTPALADRELKVEAPRELSIGKTSYRVEWNSAGGQVRAEAAGSRSSYPITDVLGGKNVYYFLTPLDRGRLQVLPVAFDVRRKAWFDTAASATRHFGSQPDQPLDWKDPLYTFNTSCHGCHVSQLETNYDPATDSYRTAWSEPGINCETCHGPSAEHVRIGGKLKPGASPEELRILVTRTFTPEQHNDSCSSCHAKASMLTLRFSPGEHFFDHFDLIALENPDYYPDGRDLGENYTFTSWRMNPCAAKSPLHCVSCHTSSGRFRYAGEKSNSACLPCHAERVRQAATHSRHRADSPGSRCISCHMPMTEFARMRRSDHSFRPPAPAATLAFKSPNACNLCHQDRDAAWADRLVRSWHPGNYQERQIQPARLVQAARRHDWRQLPEMLSYLSRPGSQEIFVASLIRLLSACPDPRKIEALRQAVRDPSPLVRASAAAGLEGIRSPGVLDALLALTRDPSRLVRIRTAAALAGYSAEEIPADFRSPLASAQQDLETSFRARPDDWVSHYNLGNYYSARQEFERAVECFTAAARLRQDVVPPRVNAALALANLGRTAAAEEVLQQALRLEPANAAVNFNLGLLKAEQGNLPEAESRLRAALQADPRMAAAAHNLGVLLASRNREEAVRWCRQAAQLSPEEPKYAYTLAFYLGESGKKEEAVRELKKLLDRHPTNTDAFRLLGSIYEEQRKFSLARDLYRQALAQPGLPAEENQFFRARLTELP